MDIGSLLVLSVGLAMDAFAASICKGLSEVSHSLKDSLSVGLCFGFFQGLMPLIGFLLGHSFAASIKAIDHWVAFFLLLFLGLEMIKEARNPYCEINRGLDFANLIKMGIATSIDALAVGVSLAFLEIDIINAATTIGVVTAVLSIIGFKIGTRLGLKSKQIADLAGGLILIGLGTKILIEHLFFQ
ncbi:manganese efflux pump MntP family protein [Anaerococcus sp. AGMB09787]|uniref:manganese efflux pump MntP n=1 Tax=Anaerococcus sp. AGMB09787 TaxID=2922869 RepID=UPI001FAFD672|nr:manganese efflux pump MntP family protein [Anaerococcus sp. AGMB09787]